MPRKVAHRKHHRGRMFGNAKGGTSLAFGEYGIQALEPGWLTARQIEAARIAMTRAIKRGGKVWINIFPDKPVTKKPAETRMGSGKGNPELWVAVVRPGRVLFELSFPNEEIAKAAMAKAIQKLPIKARIITREEVDLMAKTNTELKELDPRRPRRRAAGHQAGGAQPALPQRDRPARQHCRDRQGAPADRPYQHPHPRQGNCAGGGKQVMTEEQNEQRNVRKTREGLVVSNKMDKTAVVAVIERVRHPKYAKFVLRTKKLYAHDETNDVNIGDKVRVMETRPLSKNKRWRVVEVLERAK